MLLITSARRNSIVTALGILTLAFAIFGWGVQYKLSLYDVPAGHTISVPQAKLLSPKERSMAAQVSAASLPDTQTSLPVVLAFIRIFGVGLLLSRPAGRPGRAGDLPVRIDRHVSSSYFSFRPPPASLLPTY